MTVQGLVVCTGQRLTFSSIRSVKSLDVRVRACVRACARCSAEVRRKRLAQVVQCGQLENESW
eukprot:1881308-Amphidinium_carterae.2